MLVKQDSHSQVFPSASSELHVLCAASAVGWEDLSVVLGFEIIYFRIHFSWSSFITCHLLVQKLEVNF